MFKSLAVEKLLQWAFCVELPKGQPIAASPWELMARTAITGPQQHRGGGGLGFMPGDPHDDAEAIGNAVKKLPQSYRLGEARAFALLDDVAALDPEAVRRIGTVAFNLPALIVRCAVLGAAMEWDLGRPEPRPVTYEANQRPIVFGLANGVLKPIRADRSGRYDKRSEPRCFLEWSQPTVAMLAEARAEYAAWHDALLLLVAALNGASMAEHGALPPIAPAMPWLTGDVVDDKPVLPTIRGAASASDAPLPLAPRRGTMPAPYRSAAEMLTMTRARDAAREARLRKAR